MMEQNGEISDLFDGSNTSSEKVYEGNKARRKESVPLIPKKVYCRRQKRGFRVQQPIKAFEAESVKRHWADKLYKSEVEIILDNIEYLDCAGLCDEWINYHKHLKPDPIPEILLGVCMWKKIDGIQWIKNCNKRFSISRSLKCKCISSALCVLITIYAKCALRSRQGGSIRREAMLRIIEHSLDSRNYILFAELFRTFVISRDSNLQLFLQIKNENQCFVPEVILLIIKRRLLKRYQWFRKVAISLSLCFDILKRCVFILLFKGTIEKHHDIPHKIYGVKLIFQEYIQWSEEALLVNKSCAISNASQTLPIITEQTARKLFSCHSNLTMITASQCKSIGYSAGNHKIVRKECITLFCKHKGYIPYGEMEFPRRIGRYDVDVLEGHCLLGSLETGGHIRRNGGSSGSIGGFVDLSGNKIGLITCAHVVFSAEDLISKNFEKVEIETFEKSKHRFQVCGKILDAKFPACIYSSKYLPTSSSGREVTCSIDAAIVELYQNVKGVSFRTVPTDQLLSAGFDPENLPVFDGKIVSLPRQYCVGETEKIVEKTTEMSDSVVKFGATTGFTIGQLCVESVHVRIMNESMNFPNTNYCAVMCNQIEIQNMPQGEFFSLGDSGSFVFCINPDKTLSCIGMAIGLSARGTCLVTPIDSILQSFGLPLTLKPYYPDVKSMKSALNNIQSLVVSLNACMESVHNKLDILDKKVQKIDERNQTLPPKNPETLNS